MFSVPVPNIDLTTCDSRFDLRKETTIAIVAMELHED